MIRILRRRDLRDDHGSIILALLGIVILTTVASVGLAAVVNGQKQSRHDNTFSQALNNAESGVDAMVASIKNDNGTLTGVAQGSLSSPSKAPGLNSLNGNKGPTIGPDIVTVAGGEPGTYTVSAKSVNNIGSLGAPSSTTWTINATGTSTIPGTSTPISRSIVEVVQIAHTYNAPIEGSQTLDLPPNSAVNQFTGTPSGQAVVASGITLPLGLGSIGGTTVTGIPTSGTIPGAAETGGQLQAPTSDLQNFSQIAVDGGETCAQSGAGAAACASSTIVTQSQPPPPITNNGCLSYSGTGAAVNGLGITLPIPGGLVLNDNVEANLYQNPPIAQNICTNLPIVIPTLGTNLNALGLGFIPSLTGLNATVDIPIGANCGTLTGIATVVQTAALSCSMDPPADLVFNELGTSTVYLGTGGMCPTPPGTCVATPTYVSAIISAPNGDCYINGNVVLMGAINCLQITYAPGSSLIVDYPTDQGLQYASTEHQDSVVDWYEVHAD